MKNITLILLSSIALVLITGCGRNEGLKIPDQPLMSKLCPPVVLQTDSTVLVLRDYLKDPKAIDSVNTDPSLKVFISDDSTKLTLFPTGKNLPRLSVLTLWANGYAYDLLLRKSPKIWIHYQFDPEKKKYKHIQLAGQMNDWNPSACWLINHDTLWETSLLLWPGNYQYKLVVDGKWILDPANPETSPNGLGGFNSVLKVGNLMSPEMPHLATLRIEEGKFMIGGAEKTKKVIAFWENYFLPDEYLHSDSAGLTITIPEAAKKMDRSFIRVWGYNNTGTSNDLLIPLRKGNIITNPEELSKDDLHTLIIYFLMVDRFSNGDTTNDKPVPDPEVDPRVNFMGGDLKGIIDKLDDDYFTRLGVNTLWISPVMLNPPGAFREFPPPHRKYTGYHGYWPISLTAIDARFGNAGEMKTLVKEAHRKDMRVILDFVSHHVHQDYPLLKQHPDWITSVDLPGGKKNIRIWDEQRLTTWFDIFLPTWDLSRPDVCEMVSDSALFWIQEYDIDGFRHDAAKHVTEFYWRTLKEKLDSILEPGNKTFYQVGETFGSRELIGSYISPGMLDAQFDFNLYWELRNTFASPYSSFHDLNTSLLQSLNYFGCHHLMGNITGNQDMARFISWAGGALRPNEDEREAGWKRNIVLTDTIGYYRLASLMAYNMTIPGIPVIYYGDEFGLVGAGDPDNRRMMKFGGLDTLEGRTLEITRKLTSLRAKSMPLLFGDFIVLELSDKWMSYLRSWFGQYALMAFNKDSKQRVLNIDLPQKIDTTGLTANFGHKFSIEGHTLKLTLSPSSFEILTNH
jgi:glycosidase